MISQVTHINVSGKIRFYDFTSDTYKGLYKNTVALWFRNSNNPDTWYHPVYAPSQIEGTHYDELDEQGNFSFDFNFDGDLSGYDELIVIVNTANGAVILPAPEDGYISNSSSGYTAYFNESEGIIAPISAGQTNITITQNGTLNAPSGKLLRYSQLSLEYLDNLYSGNPTFSMIHIPARIHTSTSCGVFSNSWSPLEGYYRSITINPDCVEMTTISHEYGHWVNYRMWTDNWKWGQADQDLQEGWAIFYSFAVRNYANKNYGENLRDFDDSTEKAPFIDSPYRYAGIRYAAPSSGSAHYAATGCFMWNLYDNPVDAMFLTSPYSSGDNDDIRNRSLRVFEKLRTIGTTTVPNYRNHFKSGLAAYEQSSVDKIYQFMFDDLFNIPAVGMRSSQVKNFFANENLDQNHINFSWGIQSYPSGFNYGNYESGYKLYKNTGSGWQLLQSFSPGITSYTYNSSALFADYKITSYNNDGNSAGAPVVTVAPPPPPTVTISGPENMFQGSSDTFTANVTGTTPPYTFQWFYRHDSDYYWTQISGATSSSYTHTAGAPSGEHLKVEVRDFYNQLSQDEHFFTIMGFGKAISNRELPDEFSIDQNYPNPFNPATVIPYALPERADVTLEVYNILGRKVAVLVNKTVGAGFHEANFNGQNLSSGLYLVRFKAEGISGETFSKDMKIQLIK